MTPAEVAYRAVRAIQARAERSGIALERDVPAVHAERTGDGPPQREMANSAEARLLARFDHPSLVKVYRFWEANGTAYMVMPFYEGVTLKQNVVNDRRLTTVRYRAPGSRVWEEKSWDWAIDRIARHLSRDANEIRALNF